ncbi:MAG: DUF4345 family protein [Nannocystales bacterium]
MLSCLTFLTCALGFGTMGLIAFVLPTRVTDQFGVDTLTPDGRNEVRAVYGGFGLAMAAALATATFVDTLRPGVGFAVAAALFGMAIGRLISASIDGSFGRFPRLYFVVEFVAASAVAFATFR